MGLGIDSENAKFIALAKADSDPTVAPRPATEGSNPSDPSDPTAVIR